MGKVYSEIFTVASEALLFGIVDTVFLRVFFTESDESESSASSMVSVSWQENIADFTVFVEHLFHFSLGHVLWEVADQDRVELVGRWESTWFRSELLVRHVPSLTSASASFSPCTFPGRRASFATGASRSTSTV